MKKHHWFDFVEYLSLIGVGTGTVLSIVSKQFLYSSAPMSLALLIGFANRRRVEQAQEQQLADSLSGVEQKLSKNLELMDQQMQNMPTPEMIGDVRQSILRHNRDSVKKLHAYATNIKREVENRLNSLDQQNLGETREEVFQLQAQYTELYNSLTGVSASLRQVATTERVDEIDQAIAKLTSDTDQAQASLQTLKEYSNHTLANLQDQVNQLNRQLKSLPPHGDTSSIKREISELVRVVADLVPKRDLQAVATDLREVQQRQTAQLQIEETLRRDIQEVTQRLQSVPDVPHLRSQLEESFTQQIRTINRQLRTLYSSPELRAKIEDVLHAELGNLQALIAERLPSSPYDLVFDLSAEVGDQDAARVPGSRKALLDAIDQTQNRLILIWPWSAHTDLDGDMMRHLEWFLKQKRQLDVGWCYVSDRQHDRFLSVINRRWAINPLRQGDLQDTLKRLLALKRHYPQSFRFKVLGTAENFLISDDAFAVLGLDARLQTQTFLRNADLKLRTTDPQVIQQLIRRFDEAEPPAHDIDAHWNRAVTRYDLGDRGGAIADLNKILTVTPHDPAVYNLRGIIRYEQKDLAGALEDLNESIALDPDQYAVYCNRGYLHSESGDQYGAIADFSLAIQAKPDSAIALFYRGAASQKLEDYEGAIADYTDALAHAPMAPVVLYQRGVVYQTVGRYPEAIADLDQAAHAFTHQGSGANAHKAREILADVKQQAMQDGVDFSVAAATGRASDRPTAAPGGDRSQSLDKTGQETVPIEPGGEEFRAIAPTANTHDSGRPNRAATPQSNEPVNRQRAINPSDADSVDSSVEDSGISPVSPEHEDTTDRFEEGQIGEGQIGEGQIGEGQIGEGQPKPSASAEQAIEDEPSAPGVPEDARTNQEPSLGLFGALDFPADEEHPAESPGTAASDVTKSEPSLLTFDDWQEGFEPFQGLEPSESASSLSPAIDPPEAASLVDHSVESIVWEMNDETREDNRGSVDSIDTLFSDFGDEPPSTPLSDTPPSPSSLDAPLSRDGEAARASESEDATPTVAEFDTLDSGSSHTEGSVTGAAAPEVSEGKEADVASTNVKATDMESGDMESVEVEATGMEATGMEATGMEATGMEATDTDAAAAAAADIAAANTDVSVPKASARNAADSEATRPETAMPPEHPDSRQVPDETDTQQIGTQTLTDFFSVINAENEKDEADTALFIGDECLSLPDPDTADFTGQDDDDASREDDAPPRFRTEPSSPASAPDADNVPMQMPGVLDDLFSDAADYDNGAESTRNGYLNDDPVPPDRRADDPNKSFQTVDEESLADFCQRFNF